MRRFGTYKLASNGRARQIDASNMNICMTATQCKQQTVRTSHFPQGRPLYDISGASDSHNMSRKSSLHQKASQTAPGPLRLFLLK
jgi:hypothetical protein